MGKEILLDIVEVDPKDHVPPYDEPYAILTCSCGARLQVYAAVYRYTGTHTFIRCPECKYEARMAQYLKEVRNAETHV